MGILEDKIKRSKATRKANMNSRIVTGKKAIEPVKRGSYMQAYRRPVPVADYMKYARVILYWARKKYKITTQELDMLFALYSEGLFTSTEFQQKSNILPWNKSRFNKMINDGWIHQWRERASGEAAYYELTFKSRMMIATIYKKLNGQDPIPMDKRANPCVKKRVGFADKVYVQAFKEFNKEVKERMDALE